MRIFMGFWGGVLFWAALTSCAFADNTALPALSVNNLNDDYRKQDIYRISDVLAADDVREGITRDIPAIDHPDWKSARKAVEIQKALQQAI